MLLTFVKQITDLIMLLPESQNNENPSCDVVLPTMRPEEVAPRNSLLPWFSHVHKNLYFSAVLWAFWLSGLMISLLHFVDVIAISDWRFGLISIATIPNIVGVVALCNKQVFHRLVTFQTVYITMNQLVSTVLIMVLVRRSLGKVITTGIVSGVSFTASSLLDGVGENLRTMINRIYFILTPTVLAFYQASLVFGFTTFDDFELSGFGSWPISCLGITSVAVSNVQPFLIKNLFLSVWKPGSLAIAKSNVALVSLDQSYLSLAKTAHAYLSLNELGKKNRTTLKESKKRASLAELFKRAGPSRFFSVAEFENRDRPSGPLVAS